MQTNKSEKESAITNEDYKRLKTKIMRAIENTQKTGSHALNEICNNNYWQIGEQLNKQKSLTQKTIKQLAKDTGKTPLFFYRITQFQKLWHKGLSQNAATLSWTCHLELLSVHDAKRLHFYVEESIKNTWTRDALRKAIRKDYFELVQSGKKLTHELQCDNTPFYTFKATVKKIIDGDTLELEIDQGFRTKCTQIVRLRGINTAEIKSLPHTKNRALKAKTFVQNALSNVPFVTIKTHKTDIYGRYVVDLFFSSVSEKSNTTCYLNKMLLDEKLAEVMM